jgi:hypothetical protein
LAIGVGVAYRRRKLPIGLKLDIGRCQGPAVKRDAPRNRRKLGAILAAASDEAKRDNDPERLSPKHRPSVLRRTIQFNWRFHVCRA